MSSKGKYIGVESRVQYEILEAAIYDYLSCGTLDKEKCLSHIKQYTSGDNRAKKILKHISVFITKNEVLLKKLASNIDSNSFAHLVISDRQSIVLCLFCNSYPITYDILIGFAQAFKVQDLVSKEVMTHKIGSVYGSNRAMHIAVTEILPLLIECGLIERIKVGIYSAASKLVIKNRLVLELMIYTGIKLSGSKSILIDELSHKPWYSFFDFQNINIAKHNTLISTKDSTVGKGYLTLN